MTNIKKYSTIILVLLFCCPKGFSQSSQLYNLTGLSHGMTNIVPTNVFGRVIHSNTSGGLSIEGYSFGNNGALNLKGNIGTGGIGVSAITLDGTMADGIGLKSLGSTDALLQIRNNGTKLFSISGNGDVTIESAISTTTPLLNVNGSISASGFQNSWTKNLWPSSYLLPNNGGVIRTSEPGNYMKKILGFGMSDGTAEAGWYWIFADKGASASSKYPMTLKLTNCGEATLTINQTKWCDYVFEDDYKLKTLPELETFIKKNKHLPGVMSAKEVGNEGLDLGKAQFQQMEKIEELTLYIIQLEKRIKELEKKQRTNE